MPSTFFLLFPHLFNFPQIDWLTWFFGSLSPPFSAHRWMVRHAPWTTPPFGCVRCSRRKPCKKSAFWETVVFLLGHSDYITAFLDDAWPSPANGSASKALQPTIGSTFKARCWGNIPMVDLRHPKWWHCPVDLLDAAHWEVDWSTAFYSLFHPRAPSGPATSKQGWAARNNDSGAYDCGVEDRGLFLVVSSVGAPVF